MTIFSYSKAYMLTKIWQETIVSYQLTTQILRTFSKLNILHKISKKCLRILGIGKISMF